MFYFEGTLRISDTRDLKPLCSILINCGESSVKQIWYFAAHVQFLAVLSMVSPNSPFFVYIVLFIETL